MSLPLESLAERLGESLVRRGLMLATAESCTGGWIAKVVTDIPGSSAWLDRGFVVYSNRSKMEMLGVAAATLETHGAVSAPVVLEMVSGALARSRAGVAVAVSGVAGPGGGSADKPVGTVWLAWAVPGSPPEAGLVHLSGDREAIRRGAVHEALNGLLKRLG